MEKDTCTKAAPAVMEEGKEAKSPHVVTADTIVADVLKLAEGKVETSQKRYTPADAALKKSTKPPSSGATCSPIGVNPAIRDMTASMSTADSSGLMELLDSVRGSIQELPATSGPMSTGGSGGRGSSQTPGAYAVALTTRPSNRPFVRDGGNNNELRVAEPPRPGAREAPRIVQDTGGLAEARLVSNHDDPELPVAEQVVEHTKSNDKRDGRLSKVGQLVCFGIAIMLVILIPVGLLSHQSDSASSDLPPAGPPEDGPSGIETNSSDSNQTTVEEETVENTIGAHILGLLPPETRENALLSGTPQHLALGWLLGDPMFRNYTSERLVQRYALATVFFSTGGPDWHVKDHWLNYSIHECDWHTPYTIKHPTGFRSPCIPYLTGVNLPEGVQLDLFDEGTYARLWCNSNNLKGHIPPELYLLTGLRSIMLTHNDKLYGSIDTRIGQLQFLAEVHLSALPHLTGTLPTELGLATRLMGLQIFNTQLSGSIPSEIGALSKLNFALLDSNLLTSTVPTEIAQLHKLTILYLWNNPITGTIPSELGRLQELNHLGLGRCDYHGTLPTELGLLTNMRTLGLHSMGLSGAVPSEIGNLSSLYGIQFQNQQLTGTIPTEILGLSEMLFLFLQGNLLSGTIGSELSAMSNMVRLLLHSNNLEGTLPEELSRLVNLTDLTVNDNMLSGSIPQNLSLHLRALDVSGPDMMMSGSIPDEYCLIGYNVTTCADGPGEVRCALGFNCRGVNGSAGSLCGCDCPCLP